METTVALSCVIAGDPAAAFDAFIEELGESLARQGLAFEPGPNGRVTEGDLEVGRIIAWDEAKRVELDWRQADWEPEEHTVLELGFAPAEDGTAVTVEHRGFGRLCWDEAELAGWFADQAVAPLLAASAPRRLGDWLTDRAARRPSGRRQRESYKDPVYHRPSFGAVLDALQPGPDDVLLEVGCGGGAFLQQALASGCRAAGVDHSPEMVRAAAELNADALSAGRLELARAGADALPFGDDSFTCAAMMQVFFFLPDPAAALAEVRRVVRHGGRLAVFTVSERARGTPASPEPMASRSHYFTDEELVELAQAAGFAESRVGHPDLEPYARAAGLPDEVVAAFAGDPVDGQLLVARS